MNTDNLVEFRKDIGLTQEEMGKIIGVKQSTYACYENGIENISIIRLNIIANKFHKSLNFLTGVSRSDDIDFIEKDFTRKDIGNILKSERKKLNMTQEKLSKELNVDRVSISWYETGRGVTIPVLIQYSELFNKSIDYLCGKADN